jgi:2-oxoglutarate dehydrogenase E1 component
MSDLRAFFGPNAGYVLELYDSYLADPSSVDDESRAFFATLNPADVAVATAASTRTTTAAAAPAQLDVNRIVGAAALAQAIREYGHLAAAIDPLGKPLPGAPELDPAFHGISEADLATLPASVVGGPSAGGVATAAEAMARLRATYMGAAGFDFDHIQVAKERLWLTHAVESRAFSTPLEAGAKKALLRRLTQVEAFERFIHQTYLGAKRFSIEGNDVLVPILDEVVHSAASSGTREIVIGMAHRGRLNVMTHVLGKPYAAIIAAFEGKKKQQATGASKHLSGNDFADDSTGDVKYHLGARLLRGAQGMTVEVPLVLAPNPSHLEAVNPVVEGMVRASQDVTDRAGAPSLDPHASVAIALHGDAAFPGQGVVAETLNLADLRGYTTGGTIHIIVNNQIGFTTDPDDSRSTLYASDLAKGFEIPIVHVNADDPEACLMATRMAMAYREEFGKDFLIDLVGYRRWGHNEGDEPLFTQPQLYELISKHPTVRQRWADRLAAEGVIAPDEAAGLLKETMDNLAGVRRSVTDGTAKVDEEPVVASPRREVETAVPLEQLKRYHDAIHKLPEGFTLSPKLARQWDRRASILDAPDGKLDWAHAETLAYAAIIADGIPIRLTGQDAERGTFSQRHLVLHDPKTNGTYAPLQSLPDAKASFAVYNSPLSENACLGFEYGYSVHAPGRLVLWEGQFGDFSNGAQIIIDQFLVAARSKWRQEPALVMLLPHGYEGQGPEHSSARLERFLQLAALDNIRVANCTTAAQYFHLLRRQAALLSLDPRPLILMTPKSLLRNAAASSSIEELANGTFMPVIDDPLAAGREAEITRLVLCSGKVAVDLDASPLRKETPGVAVVRVEQLAPFQNSAIRATLANYPNLVDLVWLQEEPRNMGAWNYMDGRLRELVKDRGLDVRYIGRIERSSPAEGALDLHLEEQQRVVEEAFANVPAAPSNGRSRATKNGTNGAHADEVGAAKAAVKSSATKSRS